MAKIKYNVKGVERGGGNYEQPKPGLYEMEIKEANHRDADGKNDIELVLEVTKGNNDFVGARVWTYVGLGEASQWKLAELTDALGLPESGTLDTTKLLGKKMKVKINADSWNDQYRARAGRFAPLEAEATDDDAAADPDADADDPDAGGDEPITIELNDVELSNDPDYYDDWSDDDLKEEIENQSLDVKGRFSRKKVVEALVALVNENGGGGNDGDDPDAAAGNDDGDEYDDTDVWTDKALAEEYKKRGLDTIEGKKNRQKVIEALRADDANDDPFAD